MGKVLAHDVHVTGDDHQVVVLAAGTKVPKKFASLVTNPKAFIEEVVDEEEQIVLETTTASYDTLTGPQLKALLKERELPQTGKNADMVERLKADDVERAEAAAEDDETEDDQSEGSDDDGSAAEDESGTDENQE
jgi:hypothetical protein